MRWITRRQGYFFFPFLLFWRQPARGVVRSRFGRGKVQGRWLELGMIARGSAAYLAVLFWLLPLGMAFAFIGVQLAVFGFYMGSSFAPNHVGMPIVPRDAKLDFLSKQVLRPATCRVAGGRRC